MIPSIKELNFPEYATLSQATVTHNDMGELVITTQVSIDGDIKPDFSYDWEIEFKGEKYIHPLRTPQALKDNTSICSKVDLTFQHWVVYELKRHYFVELVSIKAGTAIPNKYIASLGLSITDFVTAFQNVLDYYYKGSIKIQLNPDIEYSQDKAFISISYSYIWDVLQEFYKVYGIRWHIQGDTIYVGYPAAEISHVFAYGYNQGLISLERQVQDANIRNLLLGRGGSTNLPQYYFKNAPEGSIYASDPDAIPELEYVFFSELRGKTFRDYVQGWKTNPNRDTKNGTIAIEPYDEGRGEINYAYRRGHEDKTFDPVEFVKDDVSIAKYGLLPGGLDNNEDIYPSIQNISLEGIGLVNEIVAVESVVSDDVDSAVANDTIIENIKSEKASQLIGKDELQRTGSLRVYIPGNVTVQDNYRGTLFYNAQLKVTKWDDKSYRYVDAVIDVDYKVTVEPTVIIENHHNGQTVSDINIPPGVYHISATSSFESLTKDTNVNFTLEISEIKLVSTQTDGASDEWKPTFDIWIKNIWQTEKREDETDQEYADRVWLPILGDEGREAMVTFSSGWLQSSSDWEFMVVKGGYAYDNSKSYNGIPSHWKLTLQKSDAELKATNKYIPNVGMQAVAGDTFFFTGIDMQHQYVLFAEQRIDIYKDGELQKTRDIQPAWVSQLDKVRINTLEPEDAELLVDSIRVGAMIHIADKRFIEGEIDVYIQTLTYTYSDKIVPEIEITLSDKVLAVENPVAQLQGQVELLSEQIARPSLYMVNELRQIFDAIYLRKDGVEDLSKSPTSFKSLLKSDDFRSGMVGGRGWGVYRDVNGNAIAEFDQVNARLAIVANDIVRNEVKHQGGDIISSIASIEVTEVVEGDGYYDCFFDLKQGYKTNLFVVDDVALSMTFSPDNNNSKSYKCRIVAVGSNYIRLSAAEKVGDGVPTEGDIIVHYGNYTDTNRQYVIVRSVVGGGRDYMLSGLDSISALGKVYYYAGRENGGSPRWFVGDSDGEHAEWKDGKLKVKGTLEVGSDVGGATVVDGGLVTAETISLGNEGAIKAGVTGAGESDDDVRFWAGSTFENRASAPFRVLQNGHATMKAGTIAQFEINENGLTYSSGQYTASFTKDAFQLGGEISYGGHIVSSKKMTVKGEDVDSITPLLLLERKLNNIEEDDAKGYTPLVTIEENSAFPSVALKSKGAIDCTGGLIERGVFRIIEDGNSPNAIYPLKSTLWIVKNDHQTGRFVFLPNLTEMLRYLGLEDTDTFAIRVEILLAYNTQYGLYVALKSEDGQDAYQYKIIDQHTGQNNSIPLDNGGDSIRLALIYDGTTYYAQVLSKTE